MTTSFGFMRGTRIGSTQSLELAEHHSCPLLPSIVAILALLLLQTGCGAKPEERHYPIQAEVISVDLSKKLIIVKHGEIPGLMPAMTMSYLIATPKEAETLGPGDKITADLVVSESKGHLEKIVLVEKAKPNPAPALPAQGSPHT